ncbi:hypothetical protein DTO006G1_133 [Penicillium roqueforti]|uniref:uncharacterized protein n=1 Tax=Penicillium roqueforti TaxID=5082 RepID=UPI00190B421B|nr:uncharacterized protein LCP9604111_6704 [Penicillium roqueforti]KAF9246032.1 hypothetical protein LCP9604111_6704 [Penicillium roqueforti]KAI1834492.1 hypothetical protein CBS147337_4782 [Penicillium roqueforti]KAI2705170.1 hypothetical protein CBS147372_1473 [Penicillium roqueforti]KAI2764833.1 hypothetical protein DTO006G1_133 [Penicillium roqueforti]KAI3117811.1 hypothetical protein CBS147330_9149 [Penicillium roqueforti]
MGSVEGTKFESIFMQDPIKAVVGKNKTIFHFQPGALIQGKSALTARVTGPWKNAGEETLDWSYFDEETIDCVLRFFHGRQYDVPRQSAMNTGNPEPELVLTELDAQEDTESGSPLATRSYTGDAIVLHAKVYSFAQHYLIDELQSFALTQMKDCFKPCLEEYSSSPQATSLSLVEAVRIIYSCTLSSDTNIDAARIALRSFIASSHEEFAHYLPQFQKETGDFMTELACELLAQLTLLQSSKADLQKTCEKKDGYLAEWRRCYYQLPSKQQNRFFFSGGRVP